MTAHPAEQAIQAFWQARADAAARQTAAGKTDAGRRGAVTAGGHLAAGRAAEIQATKAASDLTARIARQRKAPYPPPRP